MQLGCAHWQPDAALPCSAAAAAGRPSAPAQGEFEAPDELTLPGTLHDAILRLDRSELARELFGAEFVDGFLASKRMELQSYMDEITPWERRFLGSQV